MRPGPSAATRGAGTLDRAAFWGWGLAFVLAAAVGVGLRIWAYRAALGMPDSDEAIVGLMARHALHGELTTFYWGQPYGGPQEMLLALPLFAATGGSLLALRLVPIGLSAVAAILVWRVGRRTIGEPAAAVAGAVFWLWPPFNLQHLTHAYDFYGTDVFYSALLLLLALRIVERPSRVRVGLFGLVLGLAYWQTSQIIPIAIPVIGWTIWKQRRALRHVWVAVPLAALGASPWLVWNARHDWASVMRRSDLHTYLHGLRLIVSPLLPMTLGLRAPLTQQLLVPRALAYLIYAALLALFAYGAFRSRARNVSLLYVVAAVFPFVWAVSRRATTLTSDPRFLIVLTPVLALLLARAATRLAPAVALLAIVLVVSIVGVHRMDLWRRTPGQHWPPTVPRSFAPLVATLDELGLRYVYADYWIAYRLDFASHERIVAACGFAPAIAARPANGGAEPWACSERRPAYARALARARRRGFVFFRDAVPSSPVAAELARRGYSRHAVGRFVVYAPPTTAGHT